MTIKGKPTVYVAGPYRADTPLQVERNIRAAEVVIERLVELEVPFICLHTMTRFFDGTGPDEYWLALGLTLLEKCDCVVLLPDWKRSTGTLAEVARADKLGNPVYASIDDFEDQAFYREW